MTEVIDGLDDPDWATVQGRRAGHDAIDAVMRAWTGLRTGEAATETLAAAGVPASPVVPAHLAHLAPQLAHRGFFQPLEHPVTGTTGYPGFPMAFGAFGSTLYRSPPPMLGQHNREILGELGQDSADIEELERAGVIGNRPAWL